MSRVLMLDDLPNELFYEVFRYLAGDEIFYAFKRLNQRMDALFENYDRYHLDFRSWSKSKFNFVRQSIPPDQVRSLILSDADDTCGQITRFFHLFSIRQFGNLRSLSLLEISEQDLQKLINEFHLCPKLSSLTIRLIQGFIPKIIGLSLKHLSVGVCSTYILQEILSHMPGLITLNVQLVTRGILMNSSVLVATEIRRLKIEISLESNVGYDDLGVLLQCMPKLKEFTFVAENGVQIFDSNLWTDLIRRYSPQLKRFHFTIHSTVDSSNTHKMLAAFQTPFWLDEKHLITGCDYARIQNNYHRASFNINVYSLPYINEQCYLSLSTNVIGRTLKDGYHNVKKLHLLCEECSNSTLTDHYYFPNLHSLAIQNIRNLQPIDSFIDLSQLKHLTIEKQYNSINAEEFFWYILVHATRLESLELSWETLLQITEHFLDQKVCSLLTTQIKYLNVFNMSTYDCGHMEKFIEIFGENLEKLKFSVISIDDIVIVLNRMRKLYSVGIECSAFDGRMSHKEMLLWMMRKVPTLTSFTHRIRKISDTRLCLFLWIGN